MKPLYAIAVGLIAVPYLLVCPHTVCGKKRIKKLKPALLVGNHLCSRDVITMSAVYGKQIYHISKSEYFENKHLKRLFNLLGVIPINRGKADLDAMRTVFKTLKDGGTVGLFPEGTRNRKDTRLQPMLGGAAMFAIKTRTKIVPMMLDRRVYPFRRTHYVIGDPIDLEPFYEGKLRSDNLALADAFVAKKMIEVKRMADYLATLRGHARRALKKALNDPRIRFSNIVYAYRDRLLPQKDSVSEACLAAIAAAEKRVGACD